MARIVLDTTNKGKVVKYESFMSGGVPGDAGGPDGPNPPVAPDATYNGERLAGGRAGTLGVQLARRCMQQQNEHCSAPGVPVA